MLMYALIAVVIITAEADQLNYAGRSLFAPINIAVTNVAHKSTAARFVYTTQAHSHTFSTL